MEKGSVHSIDTSLQWLEAFQAIGGKVSIL